MSVRYTSELCSFWRPLLAGFLATIAITACAEGNAGPSTTTIAHDKLTCTDPKATKLLPGEQATIIGSKLPNGVFDAYVAHIDDKREDDTVTIEQVSFPNGPAEAGQRVTVKDISLQEGQRSEVVFVERGGEGQTTMNITGTNTVIGLGATMILRVCTPK